MRRGGRLQVAAAPQTLQPQGDGLLQLGQLALQRLRFHAVASRIEAADTMDFESYRLQYLARQSLLAG